MKACAKHQKEPVKGHCECPGCEVENLRIECQTLQHGLRLANDRLADELARRAVPAQAKVVAWMTEDGRVASDETKRTAMAKQSAVNFNIPLCRADVPAQASAPDEKVGGSTQDAERYRLLRRKVCIAGGKFHILNLDPTYCAPHAEVELDAVIDAQILANKE